MRPLANLDVERQPVDQQQAGPSACFLLGKGRDVVTEAARHTIVRFPRDDGVCPYAHRAREPEAAMLVR